MSNKKDISRRSFLKLLGGGAVATAAVMTGCKSKTGSKAVDEYKQQVEPPVGKMTYRTNPNNQDKVSLLGYGMMRLPSKTENKDDFDQDMINRQVDYAIEHGVNRLLSGKVGGVHGYRPEATRPQESVHRHEAVELPSRHAEP